jgi:hypothetical protein
VQVKRLTEQHAEHQAQADWLTARAPRRKTALSAARNVAETIGEDSSYADEIKLVQSRARRMPAMR